MTCAVRDAVTIEVTIPSTGQRGRVFIAREFFRESEVCRLEEGLADAFVEPDDVLRLERIERLLRGSDVVQLAVYPGEGLHPEYHAFLTDPAEPDAPLFACVLVPLPVLAEMVRLTPHVVFESATFQVMAAAVAPDEILDALQVWARRVWPTLPALRFELTVSRER